jgi:hypothetical protein
MDSMWQVQKIDVICKLSTLMWHFHSRKDVDRERASLALTYYFPDVDVDLEPSNSFPHSSTSWGDQGSANETWHVRLQTRGLEITKNQVTPKAFLSINNLNLCNPIRSIFVWKCPIPVKAKQSYQTNGGLCSTLQFSKE